MTENPDQVDVLIVGAGPTGLALAIGLARRGVDFAILDALPEAQNTSRAAVIHAGTLEALAKLDLSQPLIEAGIKVKTFRIRDRSKVLLQADFSSLNSATRFALMIPQDETEALMTARLAALGHQIRRPETVMSVEQHSTGIIAKTDRGDDIHARFVVGADGEKSAMRDAAQIPFPGETYGSFMLADVRMDWPIARDEVTLFFSHEGTLVVAPMSQDRYRVVAQLDAAPSDPSHRDVQAVIDERGPGQGAVVREVLWGSRFRVHHKLADRFRNGRILLMGDAAHVHSPAGGQGMNLGLRDAVALAGALDECLQFGDMAPLDHYAQSRRAAAGDILRMTDRLTTLATLKYRPVRILRNVLLRIAARIPFVRRSVARTLAGTE